MASEDVNFTSNSDSEDSEVNFIANYVLELEGSPNLSDQDREDLGKELEAYSDKPQADDNWSAIYEERKTDEELDKQLLDRLNGTEEVSKWLVTIAINKHASFNHIICFCDHWLIVSFYTTFPRCKCKNSDRGWLQNISERYCCRQLDGCVEALTSKLVTNDLAPGLELTCITQHPGFNPVCLQKWNLSLGADKYQTKGKIGTAKKEQWKGK